MGSSSSPPTPQQIAPETTQKDIPKELQRDVARARRSDIFTLITLVRVLNAVTISTFFQPDEYYQALEPAWALALREGSGAWITWEWRHQLRSSLHPILIAGIYKAIDIFCGLLFPPVLQTKMLVLLPKMALAFQAVVMEYYTWALAEKLYGVASTESSAVLWFVFLSPWQWFISTRAFSNTLETSLTAVALYHWPWEWMKSTSTAKSREADTKSLKWSIIFAAFASVLRPTNVIIWGGLSLLTLPYANQSEFFTYVKDASIFGSAVIATSQMADKWHYGTWTFPAANWLYFNLSENLAVFYGKNRLDYYFTEGLAWLLMTALPFTIYGVFQALLGRSTASSASTTTPSPLRAIIRALATTALAVPIILSLIAHKEVRFIYPIFPILALLTARPLTRFFHPFPYPTSALKRTLLYTLLTLNLTLCLLLGHFQNRALISVPSFLRSEFEIHNPALVTSGQTHNLNHTSVAVLMPCHSLPWRSHLVYPEIDAWALTCEPPVGLSEVEKRDYLDEADQFYLDPGLWMQANIGPGKAKGEWPDYLVFFGQLESVMKRSVPSEKGYEECWRGWNSFWHDDWRRKGDVVVWCRKHNQLSQAVVRDEL